MLKFKEFLNEGRDAPLYHSTHTIDTFISIINDNTIRGTLHHLETGDFGGVSLTRSLDFAKQWFGSIIFVLDQRKLSHNYKIIPVNEFYRKELGYGSKSKDNFEFEEVLKGHLKNLDRYIIKLLVRKKDKKEFLTVKVGNQYDVEYY